MKSLIGRLDNRKGADMASPAKRSKTEDNDCVVGYIHRLSPLKTSKRNTRYFEAMLQSGREEYQKVVVFSPRKRRLFEQAEFTKTSVKLTNVKRSMSK